MCPPPMPTRRTPGSISRRARQSMPPGRSPEASPAESMTGAWPVAGSAAAIDAHQRDPRPIGEPHDGLAVDEQDASGRNGQRGGAALGHRLEGGGADGGGVEAVVARGGYRLDHHRARTGEAASAPDRLVGSL